MYCGKCGSELMDGALFCSKCGAEVELSPDENNQPLDDSGRQPNGGDQQDAGDKHGIPQPLMIVLAIVGAVIALGIVLGVFFVGKNRSEARRRDEKTRVSETETETEPQKEPAIEIDQEEEQAEPVPKTEAELRSIADGYGKIMAWTYKDYDGDGRYEAYALVMRESEWEYEEVDRILFVDADGNVSLFKPEVTGYTYELDGANYWECEGKGFFWADVTAGGSGWWTYLFSVKDGKPYELDLSCKIQGFYEIDGMLCTTEDDFEEGHRYPLVELIYDSNTQQFSKGERTGRDFFDEDEEIDSDSDVLSDLEEPEYEPLKSRSDIENVDYYVRIIDGMYEETNSGVYDGVGRNNYREREKSDGTVVHELIKTFVGKGDEEIDRIMAEAGYKQYEVEYYYDNPDYYDTVISDGPNLIIAKIDGSVYKYYFAGNNLIRRIAPEGSSDNPKSNGFLSDLYQFGFVYRWWFNSL